MQPKLSLTGNTSTRHDRFIYFRCMDDKAHSCALHFLKARLPQHVVTGKLPLHVASRVAAGQKRPHRAAVEGFSAVLNIKSSRYFVFEGSGARPK